MKLSELKTDQARKHYLSVEGLRSTAVNLSVEGLRGTAVNQLKG